MKKSAGRKRSNILFLWLPPSVALPPPSLPLATIHTHSYIHTLHVVYDNMNIAYHFVLKTCSHVWSILSPGCEQHRALQAIVGCMASQLADWVESCWGKAQTHYLLSWLARKMELWDMVQCCSVLLTLRAVSNGDDLTIWWGRRGKAFSLLVQMIKYTLLIWIWGGNLSGHWWRPYTLILCNYLAAPLPLKELNTKHMVILDKNSNISYWRLL